VENDSGTEESGEEQKKENCLVSSPRVVPEKSDSQRSQQEQKPKQGKKALSLHLNYVMSYYFCCIVHFS
jgi:hypothetical protein